MVKIFLDTANIDEIREAASFIFHQKGPLCVFFAMVLMSLLAAPLMLLTMLGRIRVRPEVFTFLYMTAAIILTDSVRRGGSPARTLRDRTH